ncbi:uncharacterized protein [Anabrus simplex]|uniref:uncharacterized protein n=1 Tax=Anabrus simplex TaxID=316456 RepID=UPI0035A315E2
METSSAATQAARKDRWTRNKALNTNLVFPSTLETSDATTEVEHATPWCRDCATQAEWLGTTNWMQAKVYQEGPVTRAQSRKVPQMVDGSTAVEEDAPWRLEAVIQARPPSLSVEMQTSMCAPQDRERSRVSAHTDATGVNQEEEDAFSTAGPPAIPGPEPPTPGKKTPPAHQGRATQLQPRIAADQGAHQERTSAGSGNQTPWFEPLPELPERSTTEGLRGSMVQRGVQW